MKTVIFKLADKEYGVNIEEVREVIRMRKVTPVPEAAEFVEGVIALRGSVVPLVNLRKKLGIKDAGERKSENRIIVTELNGHILGMLVDDVSGVVTIEDAEIVQPDEILKGARYLKGVAKVEKRVILMADLGQLLSAQDRNDIGAVKAKVAVKAREK